MNVTDPIRRVSVVSTGQVQIRPDHEAGISPPDLVILPAHDPGAAGRLALATASVTHPRRRTRTKRVQAAAPPKLRDAISREPVKSSHEVGR